MEASYGRPLIASNPSDHSSLRRTHSVLTPRPEKQQQGLPRSDSVILGTVQAGGGPDPPGGQLWIRLGTTG